MIGYHREDGIKGGEVIEEGKEKNGEERGGSGWKEMGEEEISGILRLMQEWDESKIKD